MQRSKTDLISQYFDAKPAYRRWNIAAYCLFAAAVILAGRAILMVVASGKGLDGGFAATGITGGILFSSAFLLSLVGVLVLMRTVSYDGKARTFFMERVYSRFLDMDRAAGFETKASDNEGEVDELTVLHETENEGLRLFFIGSSCEPVGGRSPRYWMDDSEFFHSTNVEGALLSFSDDVLRIQLRRAAIDSKDIIVDSELSIPFDALVRMELILISFPTGADVEKYAQSTYRTLFIESKDSVCHVSVDFRSMVHDAEDRRHFSQLDALGEAVKDRAPQCDCDGLVNGRYGQRPARRCSLSEFGGAERCEKDERRI